MNGDTHVVAMSNNARLFHTVRKQDGNWTPFRDVSGGRTNITAAAIAGVRGELEAVIVSNGKPFYSGCDPARLLTGGGPGRTHLASSPAVRFKEYV
ncbi:hypothetical protein [Streptomyces sp. NPDC051000]|uniref:hypothetical protein n=1 Tax=Streptomyces sp. NPDC051000 TaxID=3155520 RepID=UPI00340586E0